MLEKLYVFHVRTSISHIFVQLSAAHGRVGEAARETHAFGRKLIDIGRNVLRRPSETTGRIPIHVVGDDQ